MLLSICRGGGAVLVDELLPEDLYPMLTRKEMDIYFASDIRIFKMRYNIVENEAYFMRGEHNVDFIPFGSVRFLLLCLEVNLL